MKFLSESWITAAARNDCFAFLKSDSKEAVREVLASVPEAAVILSDAALNDLEDDYISRIGSFYGTIVFNTARSYVRDTDLQEFLTLSGNNKDAIDEAFIKLREELLSDGGKAMRDKYCLAADHEATLRALFVSVKTEFLKRLVADREDISDRLLNGRRITKITGLSSDGADSHRHGRTVIGVTSDAGTFFYKPHNCSLDAFYHEVTEAWFSDCTKAPAVLDRGDHAFVSALEHSEVKDRGGISRYWFNFGCLTALFHGLGSADMHRENVMSCGEFPCAVDLETVLSFSVAHGGPDKTDSRRFGSGYAPADDFRYTAFSTGVLPFRLHIGGITSPLYSDPESGHCLPVFEGEAFTVSGYEEVFIDGFREGYSRMLSHRGEIMPLLMKYPCSTLRMVIRNTMYYAIMRTKLSLPEALSDSARRDELLSGLRVPFEFNGKAADETIVKYEAGCLLEGDFPYYCTGIDTLSLCGEDTGHVIREEYLSETAAETLRKRLDHLSEEEEMLEEDLLRTILKHAPLDEISVDNDPYTVSDRSMSSGEAIAELEEMLACLENESLHHTDGKHQSWMSISSGIEQARSCGVLTAWADTAMLCAVIMNTPAAAGLRNRAQRLADVCLSGFSGFISSCEDPEALLKSMPRGLGTGLGEVLLALEYLKHSGSEEAGRIQNFFTDKLRLLVGSHNDYTQMEKEICSPWNVISGTAGLIVACSLTDCATDEELIRAFADEILEGLPADKIGALEGASGMGAALAYAYHVTGDERYACGADEAFGQLRSTYSDHCKGWTKQGMSMSWAGKRRPLSAGIAIAASYSLDYMDSEVIRDVLSLATVSLEDQSELPGTDSLNNGSALTALAYMKLAESRPEMTERAGRVLHTMVVRKQLKGSYIVTPDGVRSSFDPSFAYGSVGIGTILAAYLKNLR